MNENNVGANSANEFNKLTIEQKQILVAWIADNITQRNSFNDKHTSYGLKHRFENSANGFYVTNGQFKGAMLDLGFKVQDTSALNWFFNISQKSLCFKVK